MIDSVLVIPDLVSQVSRSYDALMRLTRESQSIREGFARHVDYGYDTAANVLTLTYPSGTTIATSYDALGRGDVLKRDGNSIADYDYLGQRLKALTFETGTDDVQLTQAFDGLGRLTRMTYAQTGNAGLPDFSYGFDAASNITRKAFEHRSGAPSEDYGYDTLHRLTRTAFGQRTSVPYEGFVYDHLGNHLVQDDNGTTVAGEFNAVNEQTKRGTTALSHDLRGNLTDDDTSGGGGQVYLYDRQNLLTRVEDGSSNRIASYAYDALGRRIEKDVQGGAVTEFYWNGQQLVEETNATGTVQRKYVWAPSPGRGGYIDDLVQFIDRTGGSDVAYFACRHHNFNVVGLLSSSGGVVERYDYNPYGKRFVLDSDYRDDADGVSDVAFQVGHQGLMHDAETGLVYNRARMLHVVLGRFMQRDPLGYVDGHNFYQYVLSSPIRVKDPTGEFGILEAGAVAAILTLGVVIAENMDHDCVPGTVTFQNMSVDCTRECSTPCWLTFCWDKDGTGIRQRRAVCKRYLLILQFWVWQNWVGPPHSCNASPCASGCTTGAVTYH